MEQSLIKYRDNFFFLHLPALKEKAISFKVLSLHSLGEKLEKFP
jgi:hypothetical protein